jgi:hypothetical protein
MDAIRIEANEMNAIKIGDLAKQTFGYYESEDKKSFMSGVGVAFLITDEFS